MVKQVFLLEDTGGGYIRVQLYHKKSLPAKVPPYDIIRLDALNAKTKEGVHCFLYPEEALWIAHGLLKAYAMCMLDGRFKLKPRKVRR